MPDHQPASKPQPPPAPRHLALLLHAHLPYVRHPEYPRFLEEDWFFEALAETYLPLLDSLERLIHHEGITDFQITLSITPTLCAMLDDPLLQERFVKYLERGILLADDEIGRNRALGEPHRRHLARYYRHRLQHFQSRFSNHHRRHVLDAFRHYQELGVLEIIASAATHAILPLHLETPETIRAQIQIGIQSYRDTFGRHPAGFWLPECAYAPELDPFLKEAGIQWTVLESHGLLYGDPAPANSVFKPARTPNGITVFGRDPASSRQVWSADQGYPGNPVYREFYRDLGYDLPEQFLREYLDSEPDRRFTGLKYHRITDRQSDEKELYDPDDAEEMARAHAAHFVQHRASQLAELDPKIDGEPIVVCAFDAELFGHWWFEGPTFLEQLIRQVAHRNADEKTANPFELSSPTQYLESNLWLERVEPSPSTWGLNGYLESWLAEENAWIYPHLHQAARHLIKLISEINDGSAVALDTQKSSAVAAPNPLDSKLKTKDSKLRQAYLQQMTRELLLAQSSDWAFLLKTNTAPEYAEKRLRTHVSRFSELLAQLDQNRINSELLQACFNQTPLFRSLNPNHFANPNTKVSATASRPPSIVKP
ncbi:MAG: 1,4-alpha-glucan branching protein domain-containing protein [Verrucomicrobiota bacterium]